MGKTQEVLLYQHLVQLFIVGLQINFYRKTLFIQSFSKRISYFFSLIKSFLKIPARKLDQKFVPIETTNKVAKSQTNGLIEIRIDLLIGNMGAQVADYNERTMLKFLLCSVQKRLELQNKQMDRQNKEIETITLNIKDFLIIRKYINQNRRKQEQGQNPENHINEEAQRKIRVSFKRYKIQANGKRLINISIKPDI